MLYPSMSHLISAGLQGKVQASSLGCLCCSLIFRVPFPVRRLEAALGVCLLAQQEGPKVSAAQIRSALAVGWGLAVFPAPSPLF